MIKDSCNIFLAFLALQNDYVHIVYFEFVSDKPRFKENRGNCKHQNFITYAYQSNNPPLNATGSKWCVNKKQMVLQYQTGFFFSFFSLFFCVNKIGIVHTVCYICIIHAFTTYFFCTEFGPGQVHLIYILGQYCSGFYIYFNFCQREKIFDFYLFQHSFFFFLSSFFFVQQ